MKQQRVIFYLDDGRQVYSSHRGQIDDWHQYDLEAMKHNMERYGWSAFTSDLKHYDVDAESLRRRYPDERISMVVRYRTEDHDMPVSRAIFIRK